jgi:hypothetical protein
MNRVRFINSCLIIISSLLATIPCYAGTPLWTFTPLTATTISVPSNGTATVQYQVTNQSNKTHTLAMNSITGVTQITSGSGICASPFTLTGHNSCVLSLQINGGQVMSGNTNGPVVCEQGNSLQCYRPSPADVLKVNVTEDSYTIGGTISGLSGTVILLNNGDDANTNSADGNFTFSTPLTTGEVYNVTVDTQPSGQTCNITNGTGIVGSSNVTNVLVTCTPDSTTLSTSVSDLALSQTGHVEYGVVGTPSSGTARTITITNTGGNTATNLAINYPTWPSGTTANSTCGATLAPSSSCTITVTPGNTATSDGTAPCTDGTAPIPQAISISADNASPVTTDAVILGYGCIYNGGYVYALDDTTATTSSVGGKVATTANQSTGIIWSSNSSGTYDGGIAIYGISESSTTSSPNPSSGQVAGQAACNGATDGACNTNNIYVYYQNNATGHPINPSFYAAGLCQQTINSYSDWYLPAICELGYDTTLQGSGCGSSSTPTLQNMQSSLVDFNSLNLLAGNYWSSTESSIAPSLFGWNQFFSSGGGSNQRVNAKSSSFGVRCSRVF